MAMITTTIRTSTSVKPFLIFFMVVPLILSDIIPSTILLRHLPIGTIACLLGLWGERLSQRMGLAEPWARASLPVITQTPHRSIKNSKSAYKNANTPISGYKKRKSHQHLTADDSLRCTNSGGTFRKILDRGEFTVIECRCVKTAYRSLITKSIGSSVSSVLMWTAGSKLRKSFRWIHYKNFAGSCKLIGHVCFGHMEGNVPRGPCRFVHDSLSICAYSYGDLCMAVLDWFRTKGGLS